MNDSPPKVPKAPGANAPLTDEQRARRQALRAKRQAEAKRAENSNSNTQDAGPKVAAKAGQCWNRSGRPSATGQIIVFEGVDTLSYPPQK